MKKLYSLIIISALFVLIGSTVAEAESKLYYGKISNFQDNEVIVSYSRIGDPIHFLCNLSSWACQNYGTTTPDLDEDTAKASSDYLSARISKDLSKNRASFITKSPSKRYVAYFTSAKLSEGQRQYSLWDTKKNKKYDANKKITYWDLLSEENKLFEFSPDEKRLVYINDRDGYPMLYYLDLTNLKGSTFAGKKLFSKVYTVNDFTFIDKDRFLFVANRDNPLRWNLYLYNFKTGNLKKVADDVSYTYRMKKIGKYIVYTQTTGNISGPVFYDPDTGVSKRLPTITPDLANNPAKNSEIVSLGNGVYGVLAKPYNYNPNKTYPLIVWMHGGPYRQTSIVYHPYLSYGMYDEILEQLRKNGAAVLKVDYHGSYGYGSKFAESIKGNVGKIEVADVLRSADTIKSKIKTNSIYLMGNSYGGYLAERVLVERPDTFAGGISINGVSDWYTLIDNIPTSIFYIHFNGAPNDKNQALYDQASVVDRLDNLGTKKILAFHSEDDTSVPKNQSDIIYAILKEQGKNNVELVNYADENHVFKKQSSLTDICKRVHAFIGIADNNRCN